MRRALIASLIIFISSTQIALAATLGKGDYVPIAPIPIGPAGTPITSGGLTQYLDALFKLALAGGAVLAAVFIAIGGFEYMLSEAMESKRDGKMRIMHALYGLAILLSVTIILYVINPDAICLNIFEQGGTCN
jgi:hypothetical protein